MVIYVSPLKIVKSQDVRQRVLREVKPLIEDNEVSKFFVASLVLNVMQFEFWISDWQAMFGTREISSALKKYSNSFSHFINVTASSVNLRSSLLANEVLETIIDDRLKVDTLKVIFEGASRNAIHDSEMSRLRVKLMMYSQVTRFFEDNDNKQLEKLNALKSYYLSIRGIEDTVDRSDYWLQYGIMLSIHGDIYNDDDLEQSELAFSNAFQREKSRPNPNLVRVDNYYARFQLKKAIASRSSEEAYSLFMHGSQKLMTQVFDEETRHYPFKVGRLYSEIAGVHFAKWDSEKQSRFLKRCRDLLKLGEDRLRARPHKDVEFLVDDLKKLIANVVHDKTSDLSKKTS